MFTEDDRRKIRGLLKAANLNGFQSVYEYLAGDQDAVMPNSAKQIDAAVRKFGTERVKQLLGYNSEPVATLHHTKSEDVAEIFGPELLELLHEAWERGTIARYRSQRVVPFQPCKDPHNKADHSLHMTIRRWASSQSIRLHPAFDVSDGVEEFPEQFLVMNGANGIQNVFPHAHGEKLCSVEERITSLVQGTTPCEARRGYDGGIAVPDSEHGYYQNMLHEEFHRFLDDDWADPVKEYSLGGASDPDSGRVDLRLRHQDEQRYLLIEIKPDVDQLDKACGQLFRYQSKFAETHPTVDVADIDLALACPNFPGSYQRIAASNDIRLIELI